LPVFGQEADLINARGPDCISSPYSSEQGLFRQLGHRFVGSNVAGLLRLYRILRSELSLFVHRFCSFATVLELHLDPNVAESGHLYLDNRK
jgi:hypothetical protein